MATTSNPASTDQLYAMALDQTNMYLAGLQYDGLWRIEKRSLSNLSLVAATTSDPTTVTDYAYAIAVDAQVPNTLFVYTAGQQSSSDWRYEKRDP